MKQAAGILEDAKNPEKWKEFLVYKKEKQQKDCQTLGGFIKEQRYLPLCALWEKGQFPQSFARKYLISKSGQQKKRTVYSYPEDEGIFLKFIAFQMYRYEGRFSDNCYAFRRTLGVKDAVRKLAFLSGCERWYCLKTDISDYFRSIHVEILLEKLRFLKAEDSRLYQMFERMLWEERTEYQGRILSEQKGAMAGVPTSAFFANLYLQQVDEYFEQRGILYFRYSDDILLLADTLEELHLLKDELYDRLQKLGLQVNREKEKITEPEEPFEFLGFGFHHGKVDISPHVLKKMRAKIRRKARALRRWQQKKKLSPDKGAIGLIRALNRKFYGKEDDVFSWERWYFPLLNVDDGLRQIDLVVQEYIRYTVTGKHYKGNYRISYEQLKKWGYRSLVNAYWKYQKEKENRE